MLASVSAATNCRYFFISVVWSTTVGLGAGTNAMAAGGRTGLLWGKGADRSLHRAQCDLMNTVETTGNKRSAVVNLNDTCSTCMQKSALLRGKSVFDKQTGN